MMKYEITLYVKEDEDKKFAYREEKDLKSTIARAKLHYPVEVYRIFALWPEAQITFFPKNDYRTDQNLFVCYIRVNEWLERVVQEKFAAKLIGIQSC